MLRLESVQHSYGRGSRAVRALEPLELSVAKGEFLQLEGPSGSGKSTLLFIAGGMLRPSSGRVTLDGTDLYGAPAQELDRARGQRIGFVFQGCHLLPYLDAMGNLLAADGGRGDGDRSARARELLDSVGLAQRSHHRPDQLSVGERQRVALAQALMPGPDLILADEPTGNLDPDNAARVLGGLTEFRDRGGSVLLVTHRNDAGALADRRLRLEAGRLIESGTEG